MITASQYQPQRSSHKSIKHAMAKANVKQKKKGLISRKTIQLKPIENQKKFKLNGHTTGGLGAFKKFLDKFWLFGK